jgi:hypothetical protein
LRIWVLGFFGFGFKSTIRGSFSIYVFGRLFACECEISQTLITFIRTLGSRALRASSFARKTRRQTTKIRRVTTGKIRKSTRERFFEGITTPVPVGGGPLRVTRDIGERWTARFPETSRRCVSVSHARVSFQPRVQIEPSSSIDALAPKRVHFSPAQFIRSAEDF